MCKLMQQSLDCLMFLKITIDAYQEMIRFELTVAIQCGGEFAATNVEGPLWREL